MASVAVVVFTRDLRVNDHPALARAAREAERVVPMFVLDDAILGSRFNRPNRTGFLLESLHDLDDALRALGGRLVVRRGDWVREVAMVVRSVDATAVHVSDDVSAYARARLDRLTEAVTVPVARAPGITTATPGEITPGTRDARGGDHYKVFTPYYRRWFEARRRPVEATPQRVLLPDEVETGALPELTDLVDGARSPDVAPGGARAAAARLDAWIGAGLLGYAEHHDDLPGDATSRLSPYLHFGCISPLVVLRSASVHQGEGVDAFVRQLCWRDFYAQILAARPDATWSDYVDRGDRWRVDPDAEQAWKDGRTGYPVVDAAMRQLQAEGFVHNRARMVVASFLTKDLYLDWRLGARHFLDLLVDGDLAQNNLNWQWVAGTGTDTNPHRVFNPTVQGERFDPDGDYVRRYVPELRAIKDGSVHDPDPKVRIAYDYPAPIVDHHDAIAEFKERHARPT
ncbi:MAG TPA: deoxyribodipyrimidine photo-lyase [Acidimicrobiia bacterium]|nr:deoxyribodipyrimidine photo-lyase [Acidimicrobiia bacterium]